MAWNDASLKEAIDRLLATAIDPDHPPRPNVGETPFPGTVQICLPDPSIPDPPWVMVLRTQEPEPRSWLAIPLGRVSKNGTPAVSDNTSCLAIATPETVLEGLQPLRTPDPKSGWDSTPLTSELLALKAELRSHSWGLFARGWSWWVVPIGNFYLAWDLILHPQTVPNAIAKDWIHQRKGAAASPERCIVTPTGWIVDTTAVCKRWIDEFGLAPELGMKDLSPQWTASIVRTFWSSPEKGFETQGASQTSDVFTKSSSNHGKNHRIKKSAVRWRMRIPAMMALALLAIGCVIWWPWSHQQQVASLENDGGQPRSDQVPRGNSQGEARDRTNTMNATGQPSVSEHEDALSLEASDGTEMTSIDLERSSSDESITSIDGHSLQSTLDGMKSLGALAMDDESMHEILAHDSEGTSLLNDAPTVEGDEDPDPSAPQRIEQSQRLTVWGERNEVRYGRGVTARNGWCQANLDLDLEDRKDWSLQPQSELWIEGAGACEWRLTIEDQEPEVMIRLMSKPGSRWQWIVFLGAKPQPGSIWIQLAPGEPRMVLERLQLHRQWIDESLDALQGAPRMPRALGVPDIASQRRWLQAQRRETERSIDRWAQIVEMVDVVAARARMELQFSTNAPSRP